MAIQVSALVCFAAELVSGPGIGGPPSALLYILTLLASSSPAVCPCSGAIWGTGAFPASPACLSLTWWPSEGCVPLRGQAGGCPPHLPGVPLYQEGRHRAIEKGRRKPAGMKEAVDSALLCSFAPSAYQHCSKEEVAGAELGSWAQRPRKRHCPPLYPVRAHRVSRATCSTPGG